MKKDSAGYVAKPLLVMVVEDDPFAAEVISTFVKKAGYKPVLFGCAEQARQGLTAGFRAAVIDFNLPDGIGVELVRWLRVRQPGFPCIVVSADDRAAPAVVSIRSGAAGFLSKPIDPEMLRTELDSVCRRGRGLEDQGRVPWQSLEMRNLERLVSQAASTDFPVLITGPVGSGKRRVAAWIHSASGRSAAKPHFVDLRRLEPADAVKRLFGTKVAGSEVVVPNGLLKARSEGTIVLDGIERLGEEGRWELLEHLAGLDDGPSSRAARVICLTELGIGDLAGAGFGTELLHRLSAVQIRTPGLESIPEDVATWTKILLTEISISVGRGFPELTAGALSILEQNSWPGNLYELRRVLEGAVASSTSLVLGEADIEGQIQAPAESNVAAFRPGSTRISEMERLSLIGALKACKGNRRCTAAKLGVSLRTVYNMIKRHGLDGFRVESR